VDSAQRFRSSSGAKVSGSVVDTLGCMRNEKRERPIVDYAAACRRRAAKQ